MANKTYGMNLLNLSERTKAANAMMKIISPAKLNGTNGERGSKIIDKKPRKIPNNTVMK